MPGSSAAAPPFKSSFVSARSFRLPFFPILLSLLLHLSQLLRIAHLRHGLPVADRVRQIGAALVNADKSDKRVKNVWVAERLVALEGGIEVMALTA